MKRFSDLLKEWIHANDIKVASMAQYLEMDRANLYKLINGKRMPPSRELVCKIADYLQFSPMQREEFLEAYHIALIGETIYYQRKSALQFLTACFSSQDVSSRVAAPSLHTPIPSLPLPEDCLALQGSQQIHQMLSLICAAAVSSEDAVIRIVAQPTWIHLFSLLQSLGHLDSHLKIQHLLCLNTGEPPAGFTRNVYNINCMETIFPLFGCSCQYEPHFFYDSIDSHFNNTQLFSYAVITGEYVLTCSSDLQNGMLLHKPDLVQLYQRYFAKKYLASSTVFHVIHSDLNGYMNISLDSLGYTLDATPCFMVYVPDDMIKEQLFSTADAETAPSLSKAALIQSILEYKRKITEYNTKKNPTPLTFSDIGLQYFMEMGRIPSYPDEIYHPLPPQLRIELVKLLIHLPDEKIPLRLKGSLSELKPVTNILVNENSGYILLRKHDGSLMYLILREKTLLHTLCDFISTLQEEGLLCTPQETREYLREIIAKYS